jgi:hypothetical protein
MKFPKEDFPLIRTAVILLAMVIILSIAGIAGSIYAKDLMQKNKNDNQRQLADTRTKLNLVREEEQQIRLYHAKYLKLIEEGMLAKEDRLAWIENLGAVHKNRKLFGLNFQIEAQQPVQADAALPQGNLALYGSTMKLTFSLLHEGDLFNALNDIRDWNRGFSLLRECTLTRTGKDTDMSVSPHLKAECTLAWLSLKSQAGTETP